MPILCASGVMNMIRTAVTVIKKKPVLVLLIAIPLAILGNFLRWGELWVFLFTAIGITPVAGYIGEATEVLAAHTGPRIGGLLNATLGNAAELIITIVAIREGPVELRKASITGSIIGNLLFVLGLSMVWGGVRNGRQTFERRRAQTDSIQLLLAVTALAIPSLFGQSASGINGATEVEALSLGVAALMLAIYGLGLVFSLRGGAGPLTRRSAEEGA